MEIIGPEGCHHAVLTFNDGREVLWFKMLFPSWMHWAQYTEEFDRCVPIWRDVLRQFHLGG